MFMEHFVKLGGSQINNMSKILHQKIHKGVHMMVDKMMAPIRRERKARKAQDDKWRSEAEDMMMGREKYMGR